MRVCELCIFSGCGGDLYGSSGRITSPNYPSNYMSDLYCTWRIHGNANQYIQIYSAGPLQLEEDASCEDRGVGCCDYLRLNDLYLNR